MSDRLCGYCRQGGHTANKCELKNGQIHDILAHAAGERKYMHDLLLRNGYGIGAILRAKSDYTGEEKIYVIRSHENLFMYVSMYDQRNIKYEKGVRVTLNSASRVRHSMRVTNGHFLRYYHLDRLLIPCSPIDDLASSTFCNVAIGMLAHRPDNYRAGYESDYYSRRHANIECPSDETDIDERAYMSPIYIPERLGKSPSGDRKLMTPIKTW